MSPAVLGSQRLTRTAEGTNAGSRPRRTVRSSYEAATRTAPLTTSRPGTGREFAQALGRTAWAEVEAWVDPADDLCAGS